MPSNSAISTPKIPEPTMESSAVPANAGTAVYDWLLTGMVVTATTVALSNKTVMPTDAGTSPFSGPNSTLPAISVARLINRYWVPVTSAAARPPAATFQVFGAGVVVFTTAKTL